jgi:hypothetical protein
VLVPRRTDPGRSPACVEQASPREEEHVFPMSLTTLMLAPLSVALIMMIAGWIIDYVRNSDGRVLRHDIPRFEHEEEVAFRPDSGRRGVLASARSESIPCAR